MSKVLSVAVWEGKVAFQSDHLHFTDADFYIFPQIAGSYRGSYFSKIGLLIPTIATWLQCHCMISILCCCHLRDPLGFPCSLVSLHLSPCMISIVGCSWLPLPPCLPSFVLSPFIAFHLSPSFFGNAIWGLCRCNFERFRRNLGTHKFLSKGIYC